ncbi:MAG: hypothetical protein JEZ06_17820, partial [Anaerolineaceae bacterium]|nr:hypothetical protein [Anaerolineaceae bacterium]
MQARYFKVFSWIVILSIILFASGCNQPGRPITDEEQMALARLTVEAGMTQTEALKPPDNNPPPEPQVPTTESAPVKQDPTATATITETPTETLTPTLSTVMVSVSVNTNCRSGPGEAYTYVGALMEGEEAEVVGKAKNEQFWVIKNPDAAGECWIWGQYATV